MQSEFLAYLNDEESCAAASTWVERQGLPTSSVQQGGPDKLIQYLETSLPPRLLLVDIDGAPDAVAVLGKLAARCGVTTKLIALGSENDVSLYRQFLSVGIADYFVKPLMPEQLTQAMAKILRGDSGTENTIKDAKIIVMVGVRGGVGASTLAINTAWSTAHELKKKTALVDLDLQFGTGSLALDLEPGRGLRDLVSSAQRVDELMITSSITSVGENLWVLSAEESVDDAVTIDGLAVTTLMKEMRPNYDYIFVDLPRHLLPTQKRLLAAAHEIVLVTELSLIGIRDTLRIRTALKSLGCPARVTLVATRIGPARPAQVEPATFVKGVQAQIDFLLPDDYKTVTAASNSGKSFVELSPNVALTKAVQALAEHLADTTRDEVSPKKAGFLGLFGGKKRDAEEEA